MLFTGFVVSPFIVRRLGESAAGVWSLVFSIVEYYWLLDFGFRSGTLKYVAHYHATEENDKINEIVNTGIVYYSLISILILICTFTVGNALQGVFQISRELQPSFLFLIRIVGVSWSLGIVFNIFTASLEGLRRFDISSRVWMLTVALRSFGIVGLISMGYGLKAIGVMAVASQMVGYLASYVSFRRVFPAARFSVRLAKFSMLRQLMSYGVHSIVGSISGQFLEQGAPIMIGHFRPERFVTYYSIAGRLLRYLGEIVSRIAQVMIPSSAAMIARGELAGIAEMTRYLNRYCFALFLGPVAFLLAYGHPFLRAWVGPNIADLSTPLLPWLAVGLAFGMAGQYNSAGALFGIAKHALYTQLLFWEAAVDIVLLWFVIPRYGILGAACVTGLSMFLFRGLFVGLLTAYHLQVSSVKFFRSIYVRPLVAAVPTWLWGQWLRQNVIAGANWAELFSAAVAMGTLYLLLTLVVCLDSQHRRLLAGHLLNRFRSLRGLRLAREAAQ